jgi:23S rRNA (cytosine1962-C5)-methyltransferase
MQHRSGSFRPSPPRPPRFAREDAPPPGSETWSAPWVQLKTISFSPTIYPAMIRAASPDAKPGSLVTVYKKDGTVFGAGLYNPRARVPLRVLIHGEQPASEDYFTTAIERAVDWRVNTLQLDAQMDCYRVVNSDGDALSGLTVDRYADTLSVEVHSLGIYQRLPQILAALHARLGTKQEVVKVDDHIARLEGIHVKRAATPPPKQVRVREHGVRYEVDFTKGHKTGFFCDQRENRRLLSRLVKGKRVLDVCCYTGGFAVTAATLGEPAEVTAVDLDEEAIAQARRNGNLNQQNRIKWIHADGFGWMRQMHQNGTRWDVVVLDPPKLVQGDEEEQRLGWQKYEDMNRLGASLVEPGGLFVTCSCSGLVSLEAFENLVIRSTHRLNRRLQIFDRTGPGHDHPVMSNALEGRYLKVLWARLW